jgi:hypothetical protein
MIPMAGKLCCSGAGSAVTAGVGTLLESVSARGEIGVCPMERLWERISDLEQEADELRRDGSASALHLREILTGHIAELKRAASATERPKRIAELFAVQPRRTD